MDDLTKRRIKIAILTGMALVLAAVGLWFGRPVYRNWQQDRFLRQAQDYLAKADYRNASLCARKTLAVNPANLRACRLMAQLAEAVKAPELLQWSQRIVDLEPNVLQNRLDLAKVAFVQGDLPSAQKALAGVDDASRRTAAFHEMAALLAAAANQIPLSEAHFAAAAKLEPENKRLQLNLAVLHLQARNQEVVDEARQSVEKLTTDQKFRLDALRILTTAALHTNDLAGALSTASRLAVDPLATFDDRLTHLTILARLKHPELPARLAAMQKEAEKKAEEVYGLAAWMSKNRTPDDALKWLNVLPSDLRQQWPVVMATVDALMAKKDWSTLETFVQERKWAEMEFTRLALLARVAAEHKQGLSQQSSWRGAIKEADERPRALTALLQMASAWNWPEQKEELLWLILQRFPKERWTLAELNQWYQQTDNTRGLNKVYAAMTGYSAKDIVSKNNYAATALLLRANLPEAHRLAKENYDQRPDDPVPASTYAYSLHLQSKTADGLKVLQKLKPDQLEAPGIAAYYGVLLAANGDAVKARRYLELANRAKMLPEEKALVQAALRGL